MAKNKIIVEGPEIRIIGNEDRFEIINKVINTFINFEKDKKKKGVIFKYPVENLSNGKKLYIIHPGRKWNFDFKVEILEEFGLGEGKHIEIAEFLRNLRIRERIVFNKVWCIIRSLYFCQENDVDKMIIREGLNNEKLEIVIKTIKWLFIMEDIIYWHYEGRAFLYNFLKYVIFENNDNNLNNVKKKKRITPEKIKELLKDIGETWEEP